METVLFDPGYSNCVLGISDNVEFIYGTFQSSYMSLKQKKFQFSVLLPKIKETLNQNTGFYLGCLLWASYIKTIKGAEIQDNPCLGDNYDEEASKRDVLYLIDFITTILDKDSRYYINKPYEKNPKHLKVLETYLDFVHLNKGFCNTKTTDEIILPDNIKGLDENGAILVKNKIDEAIKNKKLSKLFDVYELILD